MSVLPVRDPPRDEWPWLLKMLAACDGRWALFFMIHDHAVERDRVVAAIGEQRQGTRRIDASCQRHPEWIDLEDELAALSAAGARALQVTGLDRWLDPDADDTIRRLGHMNMRRDSWARRIDCPVLFWVMPATLRTLIDKAIDLWSWRAGHFRFLDTPQAWRNDTRVIKDLRRFLFLDVDNRPESRKRARVDQWLTDLLAGDAASQQRVDRRLLLDLATLRTTLGDWDEAERSLVDTLIPVADASGDAHTGAQARVVLADLHAAREHLKDELFLREDISRRFESLNAKVHHEAALDAWARCLVASGDIDRAQDIWQSHLLPLYQARGNRKYQALVHTGIATCHSLRGEAELAERLLKRDVLPVIDDLSGRRALAIAQDLLADVLERTGDLSAAMTLRRREVIPLLEKVEDQRLCALVAGKVADSYAAQGRFAEAIAHRATHTLTVLARLGERAELIRARRDQASDQAALASLNPCQT